MSFGSKQRRRSALVKAIEQAPDMIPGDLILFDKGRLVTNVTYKERQAVLKVPLRGKGERECQDTYDVAAEVADRSNLVRLIGDAPIPIGQFFGIIMEPADIDLLDLILDEEGKLSEKECVDMILQIGRGLEQIHLIGYTHRDIKPSNILRYSDGVWTLSDFGHTCARESTASAKNTMDYWSPEFAQGVSESHFNYGPSEDIFQLGVVLYMSLTNQGEGFFGKFSNAQPGCTYAEFIAQTVEQMEIGERARSALKRMVGQRMPEQIPSAKNETDYRYRNATDMMRDLEAET